VWWPLTVIGGTPSAADPGVVAIVERATTCPASAPALVCSGTLVGERAVLTAAHCVDGRDPASLGIIVGLDATQAGTPAIAVREARVNPLHAAGEDGADLAILVLEEVATPAVSTGTFAAPVGASLRVVGYGATAADAGSGGIKHAGTSTVAAVGPRVVTLAPGPAMTCRGDSGGPVLDGDAIVAVTSSGDPACAAEALVIRVDAHAAWLAEAMIVDAPLPRPPFDPAADLCATPCASDDACPAGLVCRTTCTVAGLPPGALGAACTDDADGACVRGPDGCRRWTACDERGDDSGGCSAAPVPGGVAIGLLLTIAVLIGRPRTRARRP
jgi:secreted trypsin-like serine protease